MAFRKRVYATAFRRKNTGGITKRRRFANKKRYGKKSTTYSSLSTRSTNFGFKTKRTSGRIYRKKLWDDTLFKAHYRSCASVSTTTATPASGSLASGIIYQALDPGSRFWTAAGGAIDVDGGTMPLFTDDIILRGGVCEINFVNTDPDDNDIINFGIYFIRGADNPDLASFNSTSYPKLWDPRIYPEFKGKVGSILQRWNFVLKPGEEMTIKRRLRIQKVDIAAWANQGTGRLYWVVVANSINATAATYTYNIGYNVSFSGDVVGTT